METHIRQFKLDNGDDIIAVLTVNNPDSYIVEKPIQVNINIMGSLQFQNWFPLSDQKVFKLLKHKVVQHVPVAKDIEEAYINFVLQQNVRPPIANKADVQKRVESLMAEIENSYIDDEYYDEPEKVDPKNTIH